MRKFTIIGITPPDPQEDFKVEAGEITEYLLSGAIDIFHVRKIEADKTYTRNLIGSIPHHLYGKLVLHSHYELAKEIQFGGVHTITSRSCHALSDFEGPGIDAYRYSFLSPIYDSISKTGYKAAFTDREEELKKINERFPVVALGGVTPDRFQELINLKFAGAALLGYLWSPESGIIEKIKRLLK